MKTENGFSDFTIDEKDFRMWVFDRHNPEDSAIFEPVKLTDKNKLLEQIPEEYTEIREFIANCNTDKLVQELTEKRRQHRKELETEYLKEKSATQSNKSNRNEADDFDVKSENLREALLKTYENTDARISFSSLDYSQIKKETSNRQKKDANNTASLTDDKKLNSELNKYKTANICLIVLIFALLIFFVGQRYIERNGNDVLSLIYPATDSTTILQESTDVISESTTAEAESATEKSSLININTATVKELQNLEGIGETRAANIVEYRETYGNFASTRDILQINGIGEKTYEKIKDKITVE